MLKLITFLEGQTLAKAVELPENDIFGRPVVLDLENPNVHDVEESASGYYMLSGESVIPATDDDVFSAGASGIAIEAARQWAVSNLKAYCQEEILKTYPLWKQTNSIRDGGQALTDMSAFIDGFRAWSDQEEASILISEDKLALMKYAPLRS